MHISVASSSLLAIPSINAILDSEHSLVSIITTPDRKSGRGQVFKESELASWASSRGLIVAKPDSATSLNQHLLEAQPQLIVTLSYGRIVPVELLHGPRFGWLNVHFSLLPRWRGAAPVQWGILNGDTETGITIFKLDKGVDTGPIYLQEAVIIEPTDTTESLLERLSIVAGLKIMEAVALAKSSNKPKSQPNAGITYAHKITKEMGEIDWTLGAQEILRKMRALSIRPGIWSTFRGEKISIYAMKESLIPKNMENPGELAAIDGKLLVTCADSLLEIEELLPAGKKKMSGSEFVRGSRLIPGEKFTASPASDS